MANASIKEIKNRIRSIESTRQITKAMELVAASKLGRAQARVASSRPYFRILYGMIQDILNQNGERSLPYLMPNPSAGKTAYVVIAGDRGLAGGYNAAVLKKAWAQMQIENSCVLPIGKKAAEFFENRRCEILSTGYALAEDVSVGDCFSAAALLCSKFLAGEFKGIRLVYTEFISLLSQKPEEIVLLPLEKDSSRKGRQDILYEPSPEEAFEAMIPEYIGGVLYGALCESRASEQAARRSAMDTATQNAEEMIDSLSLKYNQARQAAITQEITEIVAGS